MLLRYINRLKNVIYNSNSKKFTKLDVVRAYRYKYRVSNNLYNANLLQEYMDLVDKIKKVLDNWK